jgi:hypothetical protein
MIVTAEWMSRIEMKIHEEDGRDGAQPSGSPQTANFIFRRDDLRVVLGVFSKI